MAKRASFKTIIAKQKKFIASEIEFELRSTGQELKTSHDKVTRDWTHRPTFRSQTTNTPAFKSVKIVPQGQHKLIWKYVDLGTKPHPIPLSPKATGFLKFQTGYSARTAPVAKFNQGTGRKFGAWVTVKTVKHPGNKPRKFSETFLEELSPSFEDRINAAVKRGLDKANR